MLYNAQSACRPRPAQAAGQVQFVMGIPNALPARRKLLEFLIVELKDLMPDAPGRPPASAATVEVNEWCLELGGHVRTGLEDNLRSTRRGLPAATPSSSRALPTCAANTAAAGDRR